MKKILLFGLLLMTATGLCAQRATLRIDATKTHQRITGFGGFVCSPQFTYNHMSTTEIKRVWGSTSTVGCNIMRLYIPIGRNAWSQSLQTAKNAKQMGLIVFASPWGQPAEWKTNGTINAKNSDGTLGYLKRENWADYAQYLEDYVQYLRQNGVELDAISIQNEPDWQASYAGCLWSASEIAEFVKTYGKSISCKVMAPETLAVNDSYANALNKSDVLDCFDIYGGHQYGGIQSAYKNLGKKGKELWMTEYLINWNEAENNTRNFDFTKDFFNFFTAINTCMLGDFNAWIHYAAKRYYGMLGDGQRGTTSGTVTKRGYVMAHFARFVTGMTRIDGTLMNASMENSCYLSQTGDTVVAVVANQDDSDVELTVDLPFYTQEGKLYTTTKAKSFAQISLGQESETCRPVVTIAAQSVSTVIFTRSRDRQPSDMTGSATRFNRLDDMATTTSAFGTTYKLTGKTKTFDVSNPLISTRKTTANGYIKLDNRYTELVMHVNKATTTGSLTAGSTTLYYVNAKGQVASHNYGRKDLSAQQNFDLVFSLSPDTLTDGCTGLLSLTCDNSYSHLTLTFGDVYLSCGGSQYAGKLGGNYSQDDSNVLDYTSDPACTSIDMTGVTQCPTKFPWLQGSNRVVWLPDNSSVGGPNLIHGDLCQTLELTADGGPFRPAKAFQASEATLTADIDGMRLLMLPFDAQIPDGAKAYTIGSSLELTLMRSVPAHTPVLVVAQGSTTFTGSGSVSYATSALTDVVRGTYTDFQLFAGDYVLARQGEQWGLQRLEANSVLSPFGVYARPDAQDAFLPFDVEFSGIADVERQAAANDAHPTFNLMGQKVGSSHRGIIISNGRKHVKMR